MGIARRLYMTGIALWIAAAAQGSQGALHTLVGEADGDRFGAAVAGLGDVDGDGRGDFAIGAPRAAPNGAASGRVRVYSGRNAVLLYELVGGAAGERFGAVLSGVGDVDGDGLGDLAVGAPGHGSARGRVQVFCGTDGTLLWSRAGPAPGARFGQALAGIGDVDGDGRADLAVGAPFSAVGGIAAGRVELLSGADGALLFAFEGAAFELLGSAVAAAGDFDGDGVPDLWIGAPLSRVEAFNGGSAFVRSGRDGSLLAALHGGQAGQQLGQWLASAGDYDGDGTPDVFLASPGASGGGLDAGLVELRSGAGGARLLEVTGHGPGVQLGLVASLEGLGPGGRAALLVGAPLSERAESGRVLLVRGRGAEARRVLHGARPRDWFGAALASLGDVDDDGVADFIVGAPGHEDATDLLGYARVYSGRRVVRGE